MQKFPSGREYLIPGSSGKGESGRKAFRLPAAYLRLVFSHSWFATVQEVLQADWQEVWHSPQPLPAVVFSAGFAIVLMCFIAVFLILSVITAGNCRAADPM
jgi:hypothetical protein